MVEKKTAAKIGLAALAATALVIGLSVGLTQKNKNNAAASSAAMDMDGMYAIDDCIEPTSSSGKSGKSGGSGSSKGSKGSSGSSSDDDGWGGWDARE